MRFSLSLLPFIHTLSLLSLFSGASAVKLIESNSLNSCQDNSSFTASLFNVVFTPVNKTLTFDIVGIASIQGNVNFAVEVWAYGYSIITENLDPCSLAEMKGLCPMSTGQIDISSNLPLGDGAVNQIPGIAYGVPDLDATARILITAVDNPGVNLACVEARLSNGQTVDQRGVSWTTAVIAGLALVASAVTSGLGHSNTAAHVASNALSLFGYFQAQAIVGLTAVPLPPIVQSWTQNFQWTMGIIHMDFMQTIATWYQKSTGGTPATLFNKLTTTSVQVLKRSTSLVSKRSVQETIDLLHEAHALSKRATPTASGTYVVKGIKRVAFRAGMEATNFFMTGLAFFCILICFTIIFVSMFKGFCELAVRMQWMKGDKFEDFRNGWFTVLKGIMYRMVLIGYPQMTILCLWEFTQKDSPAILVLAIFFFFGMTGTLAWAALKVVRIAQRSVQMHKNAAYILYSDPSALNKWGFLYVQFRATAYYFILPTVAHILVKGMFIAFGQNSGTTQAIALIMIEASLLIGASVIRPWMDKSTNTFNIAICSVNFVNAIFLLIFTDVFNQPGLVTGIVGVIFFVVNAVLSLVLLVLVLIATVYAFVRKNPDARYQPMGDDRASFIKSQTTLTTELDALGATARGEPKGGYKHNLDLDDDNESWSTDSMRNAKNQPLPPSTANSGAGTYASREPPHSPIDPSVPLFPAGRDSPTHYQNHNLGYPNSPDGLHANNVPLMGGRPNTASSDHYRDDSNSNLSAAYRSQHSASPAGYRNQNNSSPWQRGAGYDH
ncbi:hypothetical protein LZ554_000832 [Drepanopeziza brunnea f. sp. 'monogermtubi']|nr:hypothetical protein LZ554_000832 [Drepanopeziza brunnea f. sp. 'monogermtubi']